MVGCAHTCIRARSRVRVVAGEYAFRPVRGRRHLPWRHQPTRVMSCARPERAGTWIVLAQTVDQPLDSAGRPETGTHGFCAPPALRMGKGAERHRRAERVLGAHSITSSARASTVGGISRPSDFAVLRLMTIWNFVGCCTGRSVGLAPLSILST